MARAAQAKKGPVGKLPPAPHPDEEAAVARAAAASNLSRDTAYLCISQWVIERAKRAAGVRLTSNLALDIGDARLRGYVEAALPAIGNAVPMTTLGLPLTELSKADIVDLFVAAIQGAQASAMAVGESELFCFDDPIPFGDVS